MCVYGLAAAFADNSSFPLLSLFQSPSWLSPFLDCRSDCSDRHWSLHGSHVSSLLYFFNLEIFPWGSAGRGAVSPPPTSRLNHLNFYQIVFVRQSSTHFFCRFFLPFFDRPERLLECVLCLLLVAVILILLLQTILFPFIQLWVQLVFLTKPDNEMKINSVPFAGWCG